MQQCIVVQGNLSMTVQSGLQILLWKRSTLMNLHICVCLRQKIFALGKNSHLFDKSKIFQFVFVDSYYSIVCMMKLFKICLTLLKIHLRDGNVFQSKSGRKTIFILILFCENSFLVNKIKTNIRVSLLSITESLTLPGEYVTGKNWHLCSVYCVIMNKQFRWIFSYNSFQDRPKKIKQRKRKNSQRC